MHMEKTQMCVGWSCPWTEISTSPDHSGELPQYTHLWRKWFQNF